MHEAAAKAEKARAERRFNDVRQLAHSVLFDYHDTIKDLPGATLVRERLVKDALTYLDSLAGEAHGDPALQRELAAAYDRVGDVRGAAYGPNLGDRLGATESYIKALHIREAPVAADSRDPQNRRDLAASYENVGNQLLETREAARGLEQLRKSLALYLELAAEQPASSEIRRDLAHIYNSIGSALEDRSELSSALENHRKALAIREQFLVADPVDRINRRDLSVTYENTGRVLALSGDLHDALEYNTKAMKLREGLLAEDPTNADYRRILAISYQNSGDYQSFLKDTTGALESFRKKVALDEKSYTTDPANAQAQYDLAYGCLRTGELLVGSNDEPRAIPYYERALEMYDKYMAADRQDVIVPVRASIVGSHLAEAHAKFGKIASAREQCHKTMKLLQATVDDPANVNQRRLRVLALKGLGDAYVALAANDKATSSPSEARRNACEMYQRSLMIMREHRERGIQDPDEAETQEVVMRKVAECEKLSGK
jgi:tetratricopeptide (TPR) repeat protein